MAQILSEQKALEIVERPKNSGLITRGLEYESQLKVYTEPLFKADLDREKGYEYYKDSIRLHLNNDAKYFRTLEFIRYPFPIVTTTTDISKDLYKVFDARNANFYNSYKTANQEQIGAAILGRIKTRKFIEQVGKKVILNKPNTFVVVDKDDQGQTYLVPVFNEQLLGYDTNIDGTLSYICFKDSEYKTEEGNKIEKIALYDAYSYRMYEKENGNYTLIVNNPHNLNYCPARPFLDSSLNSVDSFNKWNAFAACLGKLLKWMQYDTYTNYAELGGVFPITEIPKSQCDNVECEDGVVSLALSDGTINKTKCPTCSTAKIIGAGTVIEIDTALDKDELDSRGVFRYIVPPIENLKFELETQETRLQVIRKDITGKNNVLEKEAVNTEQITALIEDSKKPLAFISNMLNSLHEWICETAVKLEAGIEVNAYANYGTEWYLFDQKTIQDLFLSAKQSGISESELVEIYDLLLETKYKSNPQKVQKIKIENNLNPAPFSSLDECYLKYDKGVMTKEDLTIKANFSKYIKRFEREVSPLVEFGQDAIIAGTLTFAAKIDLIYSFLIKYAKEDERNDTEQTTEQGNTELN